MSIFPNGSRKDGMITYLQGLAYRVTMRVAHRFNWHYAPPGGPDGDTHWCHWCGLRGRVVALLRPEDEVDNLLMELLQSEDRTPRTGASNGSGQGTG